MSENNCLVCATDEGVFLDLEQQPTLKSKAQNCRLDKVIEEGSLTKLCHKCAFEIDQCHSFVEKVKKASKAETLEEKYCILCLDATNEELFFDLSKQKNGVNEFIQRTQELFTEELKSKILQKQLVCLSCRYCVDLLTDLRSISNEVPGKLKTIIKNGIKAADLPKTKTSIVNRNTTFLQSSNLELNTPSDTDSDSSVMASRRKVNKNNKMPVSKSQRKCPKCRKTIKNDVEMYRIYRTGRTICKECWLTIDPGKTPAKKRKKIIYAETKLCSVLVNDMYEENSKVYKIEEDDKGNTKFVVNSIHVDEKLSRRKSDKVIVESEKMDGEKVEEDEFPENKSTDISGKGKEDANISITEEIEVTPTKSRLCRESDQSVKEEKEIKSTRTSRKQKEHEQSIQEEVVTKSTRSSRNRKDSEQSDIVEVKSTRSTRRRKESEQSVQEESESQTSKSTKNRRNSDQSIQEIDIKPTRSTRRRKESEQSVQEVETKPTRSTRNRNNSEQSIKETEEVKNVKVTRRREESEQSVHEEIDVDADSDCGPVVKKAKTSKTKSTPKRSSKTKANNQSSALEAPSTRKRGRSSSIESTNSVRKSTRNTKKNSTQNLDDIIEIDDDSDSSKLEKENISLNEEVLHKSKRSRVEKQSDAERSDAESTISDKKGRSKKSPAKILSDSEHSDAESTVSKNKRSSKKSAAKKHSNVEHSETESTVSKQKTRSKKSKVEKHSDVEHSEAESTVSEKKSPSKKSIVQSDAEQSEAESTVSESKRRSKRSSSMSSKESTPVSTFKTPPKKDNQESPNVESKQSKSKSKSLKSKMAGIGKTADSSESEEIDVLKSTDEDSKDVEMESEQGTSKKAVSKTDKNEEAKIAEDVDMQSDTKKESAADSSKLDLNETSTSAEQEPSEILDKETAVEPEVSEEQAAEKVEVPVNEAIKDASDSEEVEATETEEDQDSTSNSRRLRKGKGKGSSKRRASTSRKSKAAKGSKRIGSKKHSDIIVFDSSDSEITKETEKPVDVRYTCMICDKMYENKFIGLQHELTHMKSLRLEIERVIVPEKAKESSMVVNNLEEIFKEESLKTREKEIEAEIEETLEKAEEEAEEKSEEKTEEKAEEEVEEEVEKQVEAEANENEEQEKMEEEKSKHDVDEEESKQESSKENDIGENMDVDAADAVKEKEAESTIMEESVKENEKENGMIVEDDVTEELSESMHNEDNAEVESEVESPISRRSSRRTVKKAEEKNEQKSKSRRKTTNASVEENDEDSVVKDIDSDKIAEAVQETLNDMAELHGKMLESESAENVPESSESLKPAETEAEAEVEAEPLEENEPKTANIESDQEEVETVTEKESEMEQNDASETSKSNNVVIECETIEDNDYEPVTPVTIGDDESSKEVVDVESEAANRAEAAAEVEITEIVDDEPETEPPATSTTMNVVECEQVDLTENDDGDAPKQDDDSEIEEIAAPNKVVQVDENTVDSVTEINVTASGGPNVENNDGNTAQDATASETRAANDDEDNNTEDEALAQESLEELLQRKGLQIVDEFAESVTDGDEESEKETNASAQKEKEADVSLEKNKDAALEIRISDSESTEILEVSSRRPSTGKSKEAESCVVGESQIIQDVDVVEEVIHDDDDQPQSDVVQEVEVESNGNCLDVANNVGAQVLSSVYQAPAVDAHKHVLETEPISDDDLDLPQPTYVHLTKEIRKNQDMPSLDPIGDDMDD